MNTNESQSIIIVGNLNNPLPDALVPTIHSILPTFEIDVDEEGNETLGEAIPNGTYAQRIACNYLTQYPMWDKDRCNRIVNQTPVEYNPSTNDSIGRPITPASDLVGRSFYKINIVKVEGVDEDLIAAREAWKNATGQVLSYPEGYAISPIEYSNRFYSG
tara:strand:+ start:422 stop:901 length:480 start_codon:yes stop_codon:yes gene_type:complete